MTRSACSSCVLVALVPWTVLALCLAGSARAQSIDSFTPTEGTSGSFFIIDGSGFGDPGPGVKKPKVFLVPEQGKPIGLQVGSFQDAEVRATLKKKKVPAGSYALHVRLAGVAEPIVAPEPFVAPLPVLLLADPAVAFTGTFADLWGEKLGTVPGKAWVGERKAKVGTWANTAPPFPGGPTKLVRAGVHPKLEDGVYDVRVRNGSGEASLEGALRVINTGVKCKPGQPMVQATLDGEGVSKKLKAKGSDFVFWADEELDPTDPIDDGALGNDAAAGLRRQLGAWLAPALGLESATDDVPPPPGVTNVATLAGFKLNISKRSAKIVALVLPDWAPDDGPLLDGAALALDPLVLYIELKFTIVGGQTVEVTELRFWSGSATEATVVRTGSVFTVQLSAIFSADELQLGVGEGLGEGPETIALPRAVICSANPD